MGKVDGKITVYTSVTINIRELMDDIVKSVYDSIDNFEETDSYIEDENIIIEGRYKTPCTQTYFPQTQFEPEEIDYECKYEPSDKEIERLISKALNNKSISNYVKPDVEFDDEFVWEADEYEHDPDMLPGGHDWDYD